MLRTTLRMMAGTAGVLPLAALAATNPAAFRAPVPGVHPARVQLAGDVFVERFEPAPGGRTARVLERADALHPGDRLVFVVSWSGGDPAGFFVTNPVPRSIAFQPHSGLGGEEVSVDGGRNWGQLDTLFVHDGAGWRRAQVEDITHVRWRAAGANGQITYRGIVR